MGLLFLCSSPKSVAEAIKPQLKFNKEEIDICSTLTSVRDFVITVDLGRAITMSDSLIFCEFNLYYSKNKVIIDGAHPMGTLSQGFTDYPVHEGWNTITDEPNFNRLIFSAGNITKPVVGNSALVNISGRYIGNEVGCATFFIENFYLNEEFKFDYSTVSNIVNLCANPKNLPERKVDLFAKNNPFQIEKLEDTLSINYELSVNNKKFLESFSVEFFVSSESSNNIEIYSFDINSEKFDFALIDEDKTKIVLDIWIKDTANFSGNADFGNLKIVRKNKEFSENEIICRVFDINENSCSMNNEDWRAEIVCLEDDVGIGEWCDETVIFYSEIEKKIFINSVLNKFDNINFNSVKLYNILGNEIHCEKEISANLITVDISTLKSGIYFLTVEENNSTKNIKLTIK